MFAVEPSFSRVDIQGCTNLPQNRKTIHNEDINNTTGCIVILAYFDVGVPSNIWLVGLRSCAYSEFRLNEGGEKTNQNGVCSFIREQWPELPELLAVDAVAKTIPHKRLPTSASRHQHLAQYNSFKETVYMLRRVARVCEVSEELSVLSHRLLVYLRTTATSFLPFPYPPVARRREYGLHLASPWFCVLDPQELTAAGGTKWHCMGDHVTYSGFCFGLHAQAVLSAWRVVAGPESATMLAEAEGSDGRPQFLQPGAAGIAGK
ncbi:hypothetical protein B0H14DRAFT_2588849 [Mycena olivaceomarginata]|nr:hypothetical protein B0H14DRAFT_2588849 [Mycena olivaceomarginata]